MKQGRFGMVFDDKQSAMIWELCDYEELSPYELINVAINGLWALKEAKKHAR